MKDFSGRVALITGAAGGIGSAVATALHRRGALIVLVDLESSDVDSIARGLGVNRVVVAHADVTRREQLGAAVDAAIFTFGRLDVAFANAGSTVVQRRRPSNRRLTDFREGDRRQRGRRVEHRSSCVAAIVESGGYVLSTSSTYAYLNGLANAPYAASKAAVEQLGRALRLEFSGTGATAGGHYPGWVTTPIVKVAFGGDEIATALVVKGFPALLRRPISPSTLARGVVLGIERRVPRIQLPERWIPMSVLRGVINPIYDPILELDMQVHALTAQLDACTP